MPLARLGDFKTLINTDEVALCMESENDPNELIVILKSGEKLWFKGPEAVSLWRILDPDPGWREKTD